MLHILTSNVIILIRHSLVPVEDPRRTQSDIDLHHSVRPFQHINNRNEGSGEGDGEFYTAIGGDGMILLPILFSCKKKV